MPTFQFEAMDATGQEIKDIIEAANEEEAQTTIRQMGYFVTKIQVKKGAAKAAPGAEEETSLCHRWCQDQAHLRVHATAVHSCRTPVCRFSRSLKILEHNSKPGKLKNALMDTCDEIETGSTLSEAMSKSPKVFSRLYVNMIKAGEAGGALETILQRLADFLESAEASKRKVKGALIYPIAVVIIAGLILALIMTFIVPTFKEMFEEFGLAAAGTDLLLIAMSDYIVKYWFLMLLIPFCYWLLAKLVRKFRHGRMGFDMYMLKVPVFGASDREEHSGSNHAHAGYVGLLRCADFGSPEYYA